MKRFKIGAVALSAAALFVAGCGGDDSETTSTGAAATEEHTSTMHSASTSGKGATDSGSSELRANLTAGLQEHVYLAGIAVSAGVGKGLDSEAFKSAAGTLDKNSVALSKAIGSVYGDEAEAEFLKQWREHIGFFVDYTKGKATDDAALVKKAQGDLAGYASSFAAFLAKANPNLPAKAVESDLNGHIALLAKAVDSVVAGKADAFDRLKAAAAHMPGTADVLAGAIAKQYPEKFSGDPKSSASALRSGLTAALQEHVYLSGITVVQGVEKGLDSGEFKAAAATTDKNSVEISKAIESVYGADAGAAWLKTWREHIGFFVDYTKGKATNDEMLVEQAQADLAAYSKASGAFLSKANPNLPAKAVESDFNGHIATLASAVDAVVAKDPKAYGLLAGAAAHMPGTANVLAGAIAKQFPKKFA